MTKQELEQRKEDLETHLCLHIVEIPLDEFRALLADIEVINDQLEAIEPEIPFIF